MESFTYEEPTNFHRFNLIFGIVGGSINLLTLWLILSVYPKLAKDYRWVLGWYQFGATCMEAYIRCVQAEIFFPTLAGRSTGILSFLGGSNIMVIGALIVGTTTMSTWHCFFYRHQSLLPTGCWLKLHTKGFYIWLIFNYISFGPIVALSFWTYHIGSDAPNRLYLVEKTKKYPTYAFLLSIPDVFCVSPAAPILPPIIMISNSTSTYISVAVGIAYSIITVAFMISHSYYLLYQELSHLSAKTKAMHRDYFKVLMLGIVVPIGSVAVPLYGFGYINFRGSPVLPVVCNVLVAILESHTLLSSISIIACSKAYRKRLLELFGKPIKKFPPHHQRISNFSVMPVQPRFRTLTKVT